MFARTAIILTLCVAAIVTGFFFLFRNLMTENYRNTEYASTYATMSQVATNIENLLRDTDTQAREVLSNRETASSLVSPQNHDNTARLLSISTLLDNYSQKNSLISRCWLYFELSDTVLSPKDGYLTREACTSFPEDALNYAEDSMDRSHLTIFQSSGSYYLVTSYPEHTTLGLLVSRLDLNQLYKKIGGSLQSNSDRTIYLYDNLHSSLFSALTSAPHEDDLKVRDLCYEKKALKIYNRFDSDELIACYESTELGWDLIQIIPSNAFLPDSAFILFRFLPMILLAILMIVIFSIYMIRSTYNPLARIIGKLIQSNQPDPEDENIEDAWMLIENRIQSSRQERQKMTTLLHSVAPAIQGRLLQHLLEGNIPDPDELEELLEQIHSPFSLEGNYVVLALQAIGIHSEPDELHRNIFTLSLRNFMETYWSNRCVCMHISETPEVCLLGILRFEDGTTPAQVTLAFSDFKTQVEQSTEGFAECGRSQSISNLLELHRARTEAQEELRRNAYQRKNAENPIVTIIERIPQAGGLLQPKAETDQSRYVAAAKTFIAEHYSDSNLSQEMVCRHIGISVPYFSALFSEHENQNFLNYVHQYRIEKARQMLIETDDTIADIGFKTGFNSANSFIRVFKKLMQETPGKYREHVRQNPEDK